MLRRLFQFSAPSIIGVCLAALLAALGETILHTSSVVDALAGAGFLLVLALPLGVLLSLSGRALFGAWQFDEWIAQIADARGAVPRFAAWVLFTCLALGALSWGSFQGIRVLFANTRVASLVALAAPVVVLMLSVGLVILSHPIVGFIDARLRKIEERRALADKPALCTRKSVMSTLLVFLALGAAGLWFFLVRARAVHFELGFVGYLLVYFLGLAVFPGLWRRWLQPTRYSSLIKIVLPATVGLCVLLSLWMRSTRPQDMLEIWGQTRLAGWAIDTSYDVQNVRADLPAFGIKPKSIPGVAHANVVIISVDTMRADHMPFHRGKAKMPALARFARTATIFDRAYSPGNVARRSLPTMATGLSPRRVRGRVVGSSLRLDPRHVLLAERFRAGGYDTAGFFCCASHFDPAHKLGLIRGLQKVHTQYDGEVLAKDTLAWLKKRGKSGKPLFLWTHYIEPHNWARDYQSIDGGRGYAARYDRSLAATDAILEEVIAGIRDTLGDETYIVVTSNHGEGLGDHGVQFHSAALYNTEIRVPLLISGPDIEPGHIVQAVGLVDLAPTLLDLAGFRPPGMPQLDGLSVAPELRGERDDLLGSGEAYSVMMSDRSALQDQSALMSGRYKLIERPGSIYELYDLGRDPKERKNIKAEAPLLLRSMKARLARRQRLDAIGAF